MRNNDPWGPPPRFEPPATAEAALLCEAYDRVDAQLHAAADSCRACGRCCSFTKGGLVLFASALEMAYLVVNAGRPAPDKRIGLGRADDPWQCPYQARAERALCMAHAWRPLGCRTYFCDAEVRRAGEAVYAAAYREIAEAARGMPRWYGPARAYLATLKS